MNNLNPSLKENNYIVVQNFVDVKKSKSLSDEFNLFCDENKIPGDDQAENSSSVYNYISFLELLCEKTPEVSKICGETVLPTYSYARTYRKGSVLKKHTDKDQCELSLTINLGSDRPWLIWIETPNKEKRYIMLSPGDALFYMGCDSPHWRDEYDGEWYTQVFLHYVFSRGNKACNYFDKSHLGINCTPQGNQIKIDENVLEENKIIKTPELIVKDKNYNLRSQTKLEDFIVVLNSLVPDELCDKIISEYDHCDLWKDTSVGGGEVNTNVRNCSVLNISDQNCFQYNTDYRKQLDSEFFVSAAEALKKYKEKFPDANVDIDTGYDLLRYKEGQFYVQHTDSFKLQQRAISCSFSLNDDYDGGEFAFFDREIIIKTKKGDAILFPSNFMYPHEVMPVASGTRYSIITWYV